MYHCSCVKRYIFYVFYDVCEDSGLLPEHCNIFHKLYSTNYWECSVFYSVVAYIAYQILHHPNMMLVFNTECLRTLHDNCLLSPSEMPTSNLGCYSSNLGFFICRYMQFQTFSAVLRSNQAIQKLLPMSDNFGSDLLYKTNVKMFHRLKYDAPFGILMGQQPNSK